jgi:hypothetical protein
MFDPTDVAGMEKAAANLNGHETENGRYSQGNTEGNSPFFDHSIA